MRIATAALALFSASCIAAAQNPAPREFAIPTTERVQAVAVAAAANRVAGVCRDHQVRIWDIEQRKLLQTMPLGMGAIDVFAIAPDGRWLFAGDHTGNAALWNTATGVAHMKLRLSHYPGAAAFSANGVLLAIAPMGDPVQVYDIASARKLFETPGVIGGVAALAFSPDGTSLATADADTAVRVYDVRSGKLRAENHDFVLEPLGVSFTADGKQVITGGGDKVVVFLDAGNGKRMRVTDKLAEPVAYLEVARDGKTFATVLMKADNMTQPAPVIIWDTSSGAKLREWVPPSLPLGGGIGPAGEIVTVTVTSEALHVSKVP